MSIEDQLVHDLKKQAETLTAPPELKKHVQASYDRFLQEKERSPMKKKLVAAAAVLLLLVPSVGVAADNGWLGDDIYGSFEQAKKTFKGVTKEAYTGFALKLSGAKSELGPEEYTKFVDLRKKYVRFMSDHGDKYGHIDADALSANDRATMKQLMRAMTPQDDKLNHQKQSVEVLSPEQFDQYLEAQIEYNTVLAKSKQSDDHPLDPSQLSPDLLVRYQAAQKVLREVNEKIDLQP